MARRYTIHIPAFPTFADNTGPILELHQTYNLNDTQLSQYEAAKAALDQRLADGELGKPGHARALKALAVSTKPKPSSSKAQSIRRTQGRAQLTQSLTVRNEPKDETAYQGHARALREDRLIDASNTRFRIPPRSGRLAIDTDNRELMHAVVSEVGLVDESTAQRINLELMAGADRDGFSRLEQLVGKHDFSWQARPIDGRIAGH